MSKIIGIQRSVIGCCNKCKPLGLKLRINERGIKSQGIMWRKGGYIWSRKTSELPTDSAACQNLYYIKEVDKDLAAHKWDAQPPKLWYLFPQCDFKTIKTHLSAMHPWHFSQTVVVWTFTGLQGTKQLWCFSSPAAIYASFHEYQDPMTRIRHPFWIWLYKRLGISKHSFGGYFIYSWLGALVHHLHELCTLQIVSLSCGAENRNGRCFNICPIPANSSSRTNGGSCMPQSQIS